MEEVSEMSEKCNSTNAHTANKQASSNSPTDGSKWSRLQVLKNLFCTSSAIFLLFTGYEGVAYLQSTMNSRGGMGLASQFVAYVTFCFSALLLPEITIRKFGCKLTMAMSLLSYCPYIASNFYPEWGTLIPSAVLVGLSASLLWSSNCTYLNKVTVLYDGPADKGNVESRATFFFGIFGTFYLLSHVTGNLISYFILDRQQPISNNITAKNQCGIKFVENDILTVNNTNLEEPNKDLRNILIGIYLGCGLLSVVPIALILDPLPEGTEDEKYSVANQLTATLRMMKKENQVLLIPITLYFGMQEGFFTGDFTRTYIACAWGVQHVGLGSVCQGFSAALSSTLSGRLRKYTGRIPMFTTAALANTAAFILLFTWLPDPESTYMFFIFTSVWGIFNGIYISQIRAFYGQLFRGEEESAFGNFYLWSSIGHCLSFSYSNYLSISTKLWLLILVFGVAQVGYAVVEWNVVREQTSTSQNAETEKAKTKETTIL